MNHWIILGRSDLHMEVGYEWRRLYLEQCRDLQKLTKLCLWINECIQSSCEWLLFSLNTTSDRIWLFSYMQILSDCLSIHHDELLNGSKLYKMVIPTLFYSHFINSKDPFKQLSVPAILYCTFKTKGKWTINTILIIWRDSH